MYICVCVYVYEHVCIDVASGVQLGTAGPKGFVGRCPVFACDASASVSVQHQRRMRVQHAHARAACFVPFFCSKETGPRRLR